MTHALRLARNQVQADALPLATARNAVLPADGTVPEWIELLPPGRDVQGADGRAWVNDRPESIVADFNRGGIPIPLDWEHATEVAAPEGRPAPAAGWIKALQAREGGAIWGQVDWTPKGAEMVKAREYRFISPVFLYERASTRISSIRSAALTNQPNLRMTALNRTEPAKDSPMDKELLKALGLPETATQAEALAAVNKLKSDTAAALNRAETPSLDKFVPRADHDAVLARATNAEKALSDNRAKALDGEIEAEIKGALAAKKITPATTDYHKASCRQEGGLARFREFVKAAPVIAADSNLGAQDPAKGANGGLTEDQLAVCRRMNLKPEDFKAALA